MHRTTATPKIARVWSMVVAILVGLGILFRVANLGQPVYWVDEVATSMRVSGYTQAEVTEQVATGKPLTTADLQKFQQIRRDRSPIDLLRVLSKSPEHAPLYFILARLWAELFGSSVISMRSLSVTFSVLALLAMYGFGQALFTSNNPEYGRQYGPLVGQSALGLLAISPFFVAYSQEARPYSLWVFLLLLSGRWLWQALQTNRLAHWVGYTLLLIPTLYTSILSVLVVLGQGLAVITVHIKRWRPYSIATGIALCALLPWGLIIVTQWDTLQHNTRWMYLPLPIWEIFGAWLYGLAVLFFDVPIAINQPLILGMQVIVAAATLALMGYAVYQLIRQTPRQVWGYLMAGALAVPTVLFLGDLVRNGQSSASSRYMMPTHLGALVALAYWLSHRLTKQNGHFRTTTIIALLLSVSLLSCTLGLTKTSPYQKSRSLSNAAITTLINQQESPQVITIPHYIQDSISLSYDLDPDVSLYILPSADFSEETLVAIVDPNRPTFFFTPSARMKATVENQRLGTLRSVYQADKLNAGEFGLNLWELLSKP